MAPSILPAISVGASEPGSLVTQFTPAASMPASLATAGKKPKWLLPGVVPSVLPGRSLKLLIGPPSSTNRACGDLVCSGIRHLVGALAESLALITDEMLPSP